MANGAGLNDVQTVPRENRSVSVGLGKLRDSQTDAETDRKAGAGRELRSP
jgi:hypothetical protein